ncbi:MAG TPA: hypothetical protein VGI39_34985 [Polyangiaceae bacterium]|jgi:hypothetical protein
MQSTNPVTQPSERSVAIQEIDEKYRRRSTRSATFAYKTVESAEKAATALTAAGARVEVTYRGDRVLRVHMRAELVEVVVDAALAMGGTYEGERRRRFIEQHEEPTSERDGYQFPKGLAKRFEHAQEVKNELAATATLDIDYYYCARDHAWKVCLGALTFTVDSPPDDVEEQLGAIDKADRYFMLVDRLAALLT